jgi:hypothetical protein
MQDLPPNSELDACILACCKPRSLKVARIIYDSASLAGLLDCDEAYELIAQRIECLVVSGKLEAFGNLARWRHSEVRLMPE